MIQVINDTTIAESGDAKKVILVATKCMKDFDATHQSDNDYKEKAKQKCKDILMWLYLVITDNTAITVTPTTGCNNISLITTMNANGRSAITNFKPTPVKPNAANQANAS